MSKKKYEAPEGSQEDKELEEKLALANTALWEANEKLREEERKRMEFFSNMSHDLRAPLMALSGSLEYLQSEGISEEERNDLILLMKRRLDGLKGMVDDLFLLSKVENPGMKLNSEIMDISFFLEEYFYSVVTDSAFDDRELRLELDPELNLDVELDPNLMLRVMDNLFTNARKYSDPGAEISLFAKSVIKEGKSFVKIEVTDTGIGISEKDLMHIFERTYRVDKARNPENMSSGFGLAITKSIVERHKGEITCESELNKGSKFIIILPAYHK